MSGACQPSSAESTVVSPTDAKQSHPSTNPTNNESDVSMSNVIHVDQTQFESEVIHSELPVVVDFYATWCPPCRALEPILDRLSESYAGQIKFVKINSDEEPELASRYGVTGLPTLLFIENGTTVGQSAGLPSESELDNHLSQWLLTRSAIANSTANQTN